MFYIVLLILFGVLFLVAELLLITGSVIGTLLAMVCYGSAIYLAFAQHGTTTGIIVVAAIALAAARVGPHVFSGATVMERNPRSHSLDFKHPL